MADVLTIVGFMFPPALVTITVGKAAGGGGGRGLLTMPTISLMFRLVFFPGKTRGGG